MDAYLIERGTGCACSAAKCLAQISARDFVPGTLCPRARAAAQKQNHNASALEPHAPAWLADTERWRQWSLAGLCVRARADARVLCSYVISCLCYSMIGYDRMLMSYL